MNRTCHRVTDLSKPCEVTDPQRQRQGKAGLRSPDSLISSLNSRVCHFLHPRFPATNKEFVRHKKLKDLLYYFHPAARLCKWVMPEQGSFHRSCMNSCITGNALRIQPMKKGERVRQICNCMKFLQFANALSESRLSSSTHGKAESNKCWTLVVG